MTGPAVRERCLVVTLGREACRCKTCYQELLKARALQLADAELRGSAARAAALCLATALGTTRTIASTRKALRDWDDADGREIRDAALQLLTEWEMS